ncbi:MAG: lipoate--protein ligase family protein [Alphaproteobacteria bacterium]|nr:lipoate--protein ligase family protein [Alphaproteobacteria bacterium]
MTKPFRVIDTGTRAARANIAFDQALIESHKSGQIPDSIRFLAFPPSALVGRHQVLAQEVRLEHCRSRGIETARRITGGGAIYLDPGQLGWELVFHRHTLGIDNLGELAKRICEAAALGINKLGLPAKYRPRNDIEVDGRKISGTGGFFDGDTLFYQGTLLIDFDPADMVAALNVPAEKLAKRALDSAAQRVVTMRELLGDKLPDRDAIKQALVQGFGEALGIAPARGAITEAEELAARRLHIEEIGTEGFVDGLVLPISGPDLVEASHTGAGGTVKAYIRLEGPNNARVREVLITGDFFVTPPRVIFDLEASLRGVLASKIGEAVDRFFAGAKVGLLTIAPSDFKQVLERAVFGGGTRP